MGHLIHASITNQEYEENTVAFVYDIPMLITVSFRILISIPLGLRFAI